MIVAVDLSDGSASLRDADVFDSFSVQVTGEGSPGELEAVVGRYGLGRVHPDGAHLVIGPAAVRRLAGEEATGEWESRFEGMCTYAASKGWVEADGGILAHIEGRGPG